MNENLIKEHIQWKFHVSREPWWNGLNKRTVGPVKQHLQKIEEKANHNQGDIWGSYPVIGDTNQSLINVDEGT